MSPIASAAVFKLRRPRRDFFVGHLSAKRCFWTATRQGLGYGPDLAVIERKKPLIPRRGVIVGYLA